MGGAPRLLLLLLSTPLPPRHHSPLLLLRHHRRLSSLSPSFRRRTDPQSLASNSPLRRLGSFTADSVVSISEDFFPEPTAASPVLPTELAPEWNSFLSNLSASGYFARKEGGGAFHVAEDELSEGVASSEELVRGMRACIAFARDRPYLLRELDRRDVKVVIRNGLPNLFKSGEVSSRKMSLFLSDEEDAVSNGDTAQTVDLMKCILSSTILARASSSSQELAASVRNLLGQMAKLSSSAPVLSYADNVSHQHPEGYGISQRPRGQNIEMKRGDWICSRCNFMNFARNVKCLECEEVRPMRQLTGGEWECPQCDFFNYGKNVSCLRCDCKRPEGVPTPLQSRLITNRGAGNDVNQAEIQRKLAANDEKAQRWFTKISKFDSSSDMQKAIEDEDFPEITPLKKGVNRFVVGTRKMTLEGTSEKAQLPSSSSVNDQKSSGSSINETLESALGHKSVGASARGKNPAYVPFVPLPADMFARKPETAESSITNNEKPPFSSSRKEPSVSSGSIANNELAVGSPLHGQDAAENEGYGTAEGEEESGRWFKKISELNNARDLSSSSIPNENFPVTMPMRKGENRFVVGRMKDRSTSSPLYKRRAALEQAGNTNFVPFVPFPPGYFAKNDNQQPEGGDLDSSTTAASSRTNSLSASPVELPGKEVDFSSRTYGNDVQRVDSPVQHGLNVNYKAANNETPMQDMGKFSESGGGGIGNAGLIGGTSRNEGTSAPNYSEQASDGVKVRERWTGKSLEGSLVTEGPDPLDMSEEAKAERWFRRVAQIKDISELSQIPDEDFPSIMPMRKGVNRFVVSKRKTPLERRLTSAQYRRNLPVVRTDPIKQNEDDSGDLF